MQVLATPAKAAPRQFGDHKVAVGELDDALDPQEVVATVARQTAESAGEIEPADRVAQYQ